MSKTVGAPRSSSFGTRPARSRWLLYDGTSSYVNGPDGLPLEQITGSTVLDYHHDQLGSTRLITSSTGGIAATYTYDSYGNLLVSTGSFVQHFDFAGQYFDTETGLYYSRARYYDPATGQFYNQGSSFVAHSQPLRIRGR